MIGITILKGGGVLLQGDHAREAGGMHRALSPGEMAKFFPDGENPFHINPTTLKRFDEDPNYDNRDVLKAIIEDSVYALEKAGHPAAQNPTELRRMLREMLNKSLQLFNSRQTNDLNKYPEKAYLDVNNEKSLHPEFQGHAYAPRFQENINKLKPEQIRIRNKKNQLIMYNASQQDHAQHGHMSESGFFGALPLFLKMFTDQFNVEPMHTLGKGNYIKPESMVVHTNPTTGERSNPWKYHYSNQNVFDSADRGTRHSRADGQPHHLRSVMGSLHPAWFQPSHETDYASAQSRLAYARIILTRNGRGSEASDADILNFARSNLMQTIHDSAIGRRSTRSNTRSKKLIDDMREVIGLNRRGSGVMNTNEQKQLEDYVRVNASNINVGRYIGEGGIGAKSHHNAKSTLQEALMLTMMIAANPKYDRMLQRKRGADDGFAIGKLLQQKFMQSHAHDTDYVDASDFQFFEPGDVPKPVVSLDPSGTLADGRAMRSQRVPTGEFAVADEPAGTGQRITGNLGYTQALPPTLPPRDPTFDPGFKTSSDTLTDLMEHLQSADARMDSLIIKSLPSRRRFSLDDDTDCEILCKSFSLETRDLHLIDQSLGDWTLIAERLKVEPRVVKAVKVALRW